MPRKRIPYDIFQYKKKGIPHGGTLEATHSEMIAVPWGFVFRVKARLNWISRATSFYNLVRSGVNPWDAYALNIPNYDAKNKCFF